MTNYTQLRTNAGPFNAFLASVKAANKVDSPQCRKCSSGAAETGNHIVFDCQEDYRRRLRNRYIAGARCWEDLDKPRYKEAREVGTANQADKEDLVETFFKKILRYRRYEDEVEEGEEVHEGRRVAGGQMRGGRVGAGGRGGAAGRGGAGGRPSAGGGGIHV